MPLLAETHRAAGARVSPDGSLLITYGDVPAEYEAGRRGALLLDATDLQAVHVQGAEAEAFLHRILANRVKGLAPGEGNRNLLLSPKGKILHVMDLERDDDGFRLVTEAGRSAELITALDMYLFAEDITLADHAEHCAPLIVAGPNAGTVLAAVLEGPLPEQNQCHAQLTHAGRDVRVARRPYAGLEAYCLDAGQDAAPMLWQALASQGAKPGGVAALDSLRVETGSALWGRDVDDNVYPQEARWEDAFSLDKGCYIGQEVVAKIDTYGGLNKRLMGLSVESDDPVPPGTRLYREDEGEWRDLGVVTTWAYSFILDGGMALAYIKRKHQEPGTRFRLGEGSLFATLVTLPLTSTE